MTRLPLFLLAIFIFYNVNACKSEHPSADLLHGSWNVISSKIYLDGSWKEIEITSPLNVIFKKNGLLGSMTTIPFGGGWCNVAEKYTVDGDSIHFLFGEAKCIPFVDPHIPADAKIIELTKTSLTINWGNRIIKFSRIG